MLDDCFRREGGWYSGFEPDDHNVIVFNVETNLIDLWLAMALLNRLKSPDVVQNVVKAADAMLKAFCLPNNGQCQECESWNAHHKPGQKVVVNTLRTEPFLSRTASPAFSTPAGAFILVEDHKQAIPLSSVSVSSIDSPECVM